MTAHLRLRCDAMVGALRVAVDTEMHAAWTVLFGASGSGKSSLLRAIAGLWRPKHASVLVQGDELSLLPAHRRRIAFVMQAPALLPHRSVRRNLQFGAPSRRTADAMLERFGLGALADASVRTLSGGESQRVSIARALATQPRLLLLDESFTGMHRMLRDSLVHELRQIQAERSAGDDPMPILSVTHDVAEAFAIAEDVVRMERGRVVAHGSASEVLAVEREDLLAKLGVDGSSRSFDEQVRT